MTAVRAEPPPIASLIAIENPTFSVTGLVDRPEKTPRPYQKVSAAASLLYERLIIGEYAGAGKKLIATLAMLKNFEMGRSSRVALVTLGSDVQQWIEELDEMTEGVKVQLYRGTKKERQLMLDADADIRVMSYQTMVSDYLWLFGYFDTIILDEVSFLKNPDSMASRTIRALTAPTKQEWWDFVKWRWNYDEEKKFEKEQKARRRYSIRPFPGVSFPDYAEPCRFVWPLSATPMETGPMDLFAVCLATFGRYSPLGTNPDLFKRRYCNVQKFVAHIPKYSRGRKVGTRAMTMEKIRGFKDDAAKEHVKALLTNRFIRHPFSVIEQYLPPIEVIPIWLTMTGKQAERYMEITDTSKVIMDLVQKEAGRNITEKEVGAAIKLFYQLRCCDGLTSLPGQDSKMSVKMGWTMDMLTGELADEKVILNSRFHQPLDDLEKRHQEEGRLFVRLDGNHSDEENDAARIAFTTSKHPITLLMTDKGSYALNLQAECNYGIAYNTKFNPKKLEQLYGRNRRPKPGHVGGYDESHKVIWYHPLTDYARYQNREIASCEQGQWLILQDREQDFSDLFGVETELFETLTPNQQRALIQGDLTQLLA